MKPKNRLTVLLFLLQQTKISKIKAALVQDCCLYNSKIIDMKDNNANMYILYS